MNAGVRILLPLFVLLLITSCVSAPPPPPPVRRVAPVPVIALPPPVPLASDWRDWPQTPGDWSYAAKENGTVAMFGQAGATAVTLGCDRSARSIMLTTPAAGAGTVTLRTTSQTRSLRTDSTGTAILPATDTLLDAIAFSRGRFVVEQPGTPPLVLPAWAEVGRVIEDCRG